jgi:hypothetical protein
MSHINRRLRFLSLIFAACMLSASVTHADSKQPFCDLSVLPEIRDYANPQVIAQIDGRFDSTGRKWWWDIGVNLVFVPTLGFSSAKYYGWKEFGPNKPTEKFHLRPDNKSRYSKEFAKLRGKCAQYLRKNFAHDILFDDGTTVIAEHYFCSEPGVNGTVGATPEYNNGDGNQYSIWVMQGTPVYGPDKTPDEIHATKCKKLSACYGRAKSEKQMEWVQRVNQRMGCF